MKEKRMAGKITLEEKDIIIKLPRPIEGYKILALFQKLIAKTTEPANKTFMFECRTTPHNYHCFINEYGFKFIPCINSLRITLFNFKKGRRKKNKHIEFVLKPLHLEKEYSEIILGVYYKKKKIDRTDKNFDKISSYFDHLARIVLELANSKE